MREHLLHMKYLRKYKGEILLTKKAKTFIKADDRVSFYRDVFKQYCSGFNWAYSDGYPESSIVQFGFGFTFYLLSKYGDTPQETSFYFDKYMRAFPKILMDFRSDEQASNCYRTRVFNRFLERFGLVDKVFKEKRGFEKVFTYTRSKLFVQMIEWRL
jgi:hypothetical protein